MPNTIPAIDHAGIVREVLELGRTAPCDVRTSGAITVGRAGEQLAPLGEMAELGVRFFTDDGAGVADARLMRRAMEYAASLPGVVLAQHCEDPVLSAGGHMHEGEWSARLGIPGQPAEAEELMVLRDLALARLTGTRVHFQHLSTARSIEMVRQAKADGLPVTCEATTHHFTLTHAECAGYDPVFKVNPPLRTDADVAAVRDGLADGAIDCIATDHAPAHPGGQGGGLRPGAARDARPRDGAGPRPHRARPQDRPGARPAVVAAGRILGVDDQHGLPVEPGNPANLTVIDPSATWTVDPAAAGQPQPQHPLRRPHPHRQGPPHPPVRRARRRSMGRPSVE